MYQLLKFEDNYADEFDVDSFAVMDMKDVENLFSLVEMWFEVFPNEKLEIHFGSNEELKFSNYKDFRNCFTVSNLTETEADNFIRFFPHYDKENPIKAKFGCEYFFDKYLFLERILEDEDKVPNHLMKQIKHIAPDCFDETNAN